MTKSAGSRGWEQAAKKIPLNKIVKIVTLMVLTLIPIRGALPKQESSLESQIARLLEQFQDPQIQQALWVQDLRRGKTLFKKNGDLKLIPASNAKILSTYAALRYLGPQYRFRTQFLGEAPDDSGHLKVLTLKGFGDPTLTTERLWKMAGALRARGIRSVGELRLDASYFAGNTYPGRFKNSQVDAAYNAPVSALSVDQNLLTLVVRPGPKAGAPAFVDLSPPLPGFPMENKVVTGGKKAKILIRNRRQDPSDESVLLRGQIPLASNPQIFQLAQTDPVRTTARRLHQALKKFGITSPEDALQKPAPPNAELLYESLSTPLGEIIRESNKNSNNFVTEQILKTMGARSSGQAGTTPLGIAVLKKNLEKIGIPPEEIQLENGSGLSRNNRLSVKTLMQVLATAYQDPYLQGDFLSSLSVLGVDGTLKDKFFDKGLEWRFRGKTGTLSGVTSLSGFVFPQSGGGPIALAFIANGNGPGFWKQMQFQQKLLELLIQS